MYLIITNIDNVYVRLLQLYLAMPLNAVENTTPCCKNSPLQDSLSKIASPTYFPISLPHLRSTFPVLNPAPCRKVGRLGNIEAGVEARVIAVRKCDDEITRLLAYLHIIIVGTSTF